MHKLKRPEKPSQLSAEKVAELTKSFIENGTRVWNKQYIKKPLMEMSNDNCAYCECSVNEEGKYVEVEHFAHKNLYKDSVVEWTNLLPSCKRCNVKKGRHDVKKEPIINPCEEDPRKHLRLKNYRFRGITKKGEVTYEVLDLNDIDQLMETRFKIGEKVYERLKDIKQHVEILKKGDKLNQKLLNKVTSPFKKLMKLGLPNSEYCSIVATVLLGSQDYVTIRSYLCEGNIWDDEFQDIEDGLESIAYQEFNKKD